MRTVTAGAMLVLVSLAAAPAGADTGRHGGTEAAPVPTEVLQTAAEPEQKACIAQTIYHEARGEPEEAQRAIAAVVLNRAADPEFPDTPCDVVRQGGVEPPCQFSWWCDGRSDAPAEGDAWIRALVIADEMVENPALDPTEGATYFHNVGVSPKWSTVFDHVATIGEHAFYLDPAKEAAAPNAPDQLAQRP